MNHYFLKDKNYKENSKHFSRSCHSLLLQVHSSSNVMSILFPRIKYIYPQNVMSTLFPRKIWWYWDQIIYLYCFSHFRTRMCSLEHKGLFMLVWGRWITKKCMFTWAESRGRKGTDLKDWWIFHHPLKYKDLRGFLMQCLIYPLHII